MICEALTVTAGSLNGNGISGRYIPCSHQAKWRIVRWNDGSVSNVCGYHVREAKRWNESRIRFAATMNREPEKLNEISPIEAEPESKYKVTIWKRDRIWYAGILDTETDTPIDLSQIPTYRYLRSASTLKGAFWIDSGTKAGAAADAAIMREWLKGNTPAD